MRLGEGASPYYSSCFSMFSLIICMGIWLTPLRHRGDLHLAPHWKSNNAVTFAHDQKRNFRIPLVLNF
jgi:hypothetical protein